jgi:hypothetical protein
METSDTVGKPYLGVHQTGSRPDRALYLPKAWTDDTAWMAAAHVPQATGFATKPGLAVGMIKRAVTVIAHQGGAGGCARAVDMSQGMGDAATAIWPE